MVAAQCAGLSCTRCGATGDDLVTVQETNAKTSTLLTVSDTTSNERSHKHEAVADSDDTAGMPS
jgi:hypothetical protein